MSRRRSFLGKRLVLCFIIVFSSIWFVFIPKSAGAAQITSRSLTLQAGATDGGSKPGGVVKHLYSFTIPGGSNVGSIQFLYCVEAGGTCVTPTGLLTTAATLDDQTGATGFTMVNTTNGAPHLTRVAADITAQAVTYLFGSVTNPTTTNQSFYVRISTFASTDATGSPIDTGVVAASTATQIELTGIMPESLIFCTGATISKTSGVPDCTTATAGTVSFNQLFSPTDTATATSQMSASTNAGTGYSITVNGPTLTSGSNTVLAMNSATTSIRGTSQFGMNLKLNTTATSDPAVGAEIDATSNGTNLKGQVASGYNTQDTFKFTSGDSVADSAFGGAGPTDAQIYTVSYIVNVSGSQAAGTYTTTLTYICTPTF
ncbi:MAG TPA: hypothetical protein PLO25_01170 [Candidatus Saccharibacteria bacterium]|nr:hypothetical protein [Candidatus Saccharibacteria bacterium]